MNGRHEILSSVMREAEKPGSEIAPSELVEAVQLHSDPINALTNTDDSHDFFRAMGHQFGFFQRTNVHGWSPTDEDVRLWAALVRWLARELREWRAQSDPRCHRLTVLFVATRYCDLDDGFWAALPNGVEENEDLLSTLQKLVTKASYNFNTRGFGPAPIWEQEAVEEFTQADASEDWFAISEQWRSLENAFIPNTFLVQTVRCLHRFGFKRLVQASDGFRQTPIAMLTTDALSVEQRMGLGIASDNPYVQFACVYGTLSDRPRISHMEDAEQELLVGLLLKVATDGPRWAQWMQVFNRYPVRYPALQAPMGRALASAPQHAVQAYLESIQLHASQNPDNRRLVTECLRAFRATATPDRQQTLWRLAHDRWAEWQFDLSNKDTYLFEIMGSELDYAIVAYAVECLNDAEREAMRAAIHGRLVVLDNTWHASLTDCLSSWNRLLSQFQPYAHADGAVHSNKDWLAEGNHYWPSDLHGQDYVKIMYSVR